MATLRQSAWSGDAGEDPGSATFGSTPVEGNLLIAIASERSGNSQSTYTISGTGWTKDTTASRDVELADGSFRRTQIVWYKIAGASEPTTVEVDNSTTASKWLTLLEYQPDTGDDDWTFLASASNDNGTTNDATSIATGTTASVSGSRFLEVAFLTARRGNHIDTWTTSYTNGIAVDADYGALGNAMGHGAGSDGDDTVEDAKSSTITISGVSTANTGLIAGILVFRLIAPAGGATPKGVFGLPIHGPFAGPFGT